MHSHVARAHASQPDKNLRPAPRQLHGLSLGFVLRLGAASGLRGLDLSRFTRLKKLQLFGFNLDRASELGWQLRLPRLLRVLYLHALEISIFKVSPSPAADPIPPADGFHNRPMCSSFKGGSCCVMTGCTEDKSDKESCEAASSAIAEHALAHAGTSLLTLTTHTDPPAPGWQELAAQRAVQGGILEALTALQELRISTAGTELFTFHLTGLPPSLRHVTIAHGHKPPYLAPYMLIIAAPFEALRGAAGLRPSRTGSPTPYQAAASQPWAPACPELLSLVVNCQMAAMPALMPLPACCAVALDTADLTIARTREDALRGGTACEQAISCACYVTAA